MNRLSCSCLHLPPNVTCLDFTLSNGFCQMKIKYPVLLDCQFTLSVVPTYAILKVILKMEIIMENKFVKKPTPKGDKTTKIVFIGLLVALLFVIAGTAIFFAVNDSGKAAKGSASSSKSSTTVYSGSNAEDPLFKITLTTFGDNKEFLLVTPNPGHDRNMFNIVGVAGQYLVTQEYKGDVSGKKNAKGETLYKYDYFNIYVYDTEKPNQKPKQIDLLKLAKKAGDEDYLNQAGLRLFMLNDQAYLQMPFGASSADFASNKKYLNLKTQKIEEMNISANSNTLDSELEYANVDMRKTLEPFGLEMWPGAIRLEHQLRVYLLFITFLKKTGASIWIVQTLPKSKRKLMKLLRPNMLESIRFQVKSITKAGSIPCSIGWHLKGRMPTSYPLGLLDRLRKKVKSSPIKNCSLGMTTISEKNRGSYFWNQ